ncbi:hypothetical protein [Natronosalvus rutilus]|uniref:Uncharacterized protein n=1 Tax=Natronosalvus rutilus TaxID=2953753 RepID=A0A9E7NFS3_9EURY|nr:hypothetical protein [Natronosalvus rutilus]UTF56013.1 hypothetical protein NGM29_20715 [Natronosalvus rutilus]
MHELVIGLVGGAGLTAGIGYLAYLLVTSRPDPDATADADAVDDEGEADREPIEFAEVCLAAARAKSRRDQGIHQETDLEFVEGVDAVLGELLAMDRGDDPLELQLAFLVGGEDLDFDVDEVGREDLKDLAGVIYQHVGDDLRRKL